MIRYCLFLLIPFGYYPAEAQETIATEPFDYPAGDLIGRGAATQGWAGGWERLYGNPADATVDAGGIELPGMRRQTLAGRARLGPAAVGVQRRLTQVHSPADGPLWLGVAVAATPGSFDPVGQVALVDLSQEDFRARRFSLGKAGGENLAVADGVGHYPRSLRVPVSPGGWLVAALYPSGRGRWLAYAWANPAIGSIPDTARADLRAMPIYAERFDGIWLQTLAEDGLDWFVDDLRLGHSFEAVTPADWQVFEPRENEVVREPFDYAATAELRALGGGMGFAGPWRRLGNGVYAVTDDRFTVADTLETQPSLLDLDYMGRAAPARYLRSLNSPYSDTIAEYWLGANLSIVYDNPANVAQLFLARSGQLGTTGPAGQLFQIGKAFRDDRLAIGRPGNYVFLDDVPATGDRFLVVRARPAAGRTRFDIWVNPEPDKLPLEEEIAGTIRLDLPVGGWDAIGLKVEGERGVRMRVDDIGLATTFGEVVPPRWRKTTSISSGPSPFVGARLSPNPSGALVPDLSFDGAGLTSGSVYLIDPAGRKGDELPFYPSGQDRFRVPLPASWADLPSGHYRIVLEAPGRRSVVTWIKTQ